jgi:hypothetical protein
MASFSAGPDGGLVAKSGPAPYVPKAQNVQGGLINAATAKTVQSHQEAAAAYKNLGAGQKGGRRRKMRGGSTPANVPASTLPTTHSMPGVSHESTLKSLVDNHNQLKASAVYDKLGSAPPKMIGGRKKRSRKTKKHGRRSKRNNMGRSRSRSRVSRRSRRTL